MNAAVRDLPIQNPVKEYLNKTKRMFIDGLWVEAAFGKSFADVNPSTGGRQRLSWQTLPSGLEDQLTPHNRLGHPTHHFVAPKRSIAPSTAPVRPVDLPGRPRFEDTEVRR